jgi:hypothetical protein
MPKLTEREREGFEKILAHDLKAINAKFMNQIKDFWGVARVEVLKTKGWDKLIREKNQLEIQKKEMINRIHEIEEILNSEHLTAEQAVELGGKANDRGRVEGANFYGVPVTSQFEYEIVEFIRTNIDIEVPAKILRDICESSIRALTMAGTFEEARESYNKFYSLDFRKYGVDIPPRLDELCNDKKLLELAHQSLRQIEGRKDDPEIKRLESAREQTTYIR